MPKHNGILMDCNDYAVAVITASIDMSAWRNITLTHDRSTSSAIHLLDDDHLTVIIKTHKLVCNQLASSIADNTELITDDIVGGSITCHHTGSFNLIHKNFNPGSHKSHDSDIKIYHTGQDNSTFHITDTLVNPTVPAASLTGIFGMDSYFLDIYLNLITILCKECFDNECNAIMLPLACGTQCYTTS